MSGTETPRNGQLAQWFEFFKDMTGTKATGLQKFLVAAVILGVPIVLMVVVIVVCLVVFRVNLWGYWPWIASGGAVCTGGLWVRQLAQKRRRLTTGAQPGQDPVGGEPGPERRESADDNGDDVPDGAG